VSSGPEKKAIFGVNRIAAIDKMRDGRPDAGEDRLTLPEPRGCGYVDRVRYRSIHFHGERLCVPLGEAARYLGELEWILGRAPHVLCLHHDFSGEDEGSDFAWRVTLVLSVPEIDVDAPAHEGCSPQR
jgi:hypothetical protein